MPSSVEIGSVGSFLKFIYVFSLFSNYHPLEKGRALHLNKLEYPSHKDALCLVWLKLAQWFWRRRFLKFLNNILQFCNYLLLERGRALHLKKQDFPLLQDASCQVWLKLALWFLRRFLKLVNVFSLFPYYLPLEMGRVLHLNKLKSPLP